MNITQYASIFVLEINVNLPTMKLKLGSTLADSIQVYGTYMYTVHIYYIATELAIYQLLLVLIARVVSLNGSLKG